MCASEHLAPRLTATVHAKAHKKPSSSLRAAGGCNERTRAPTCRGDRADVAEIGFKAMMNGEGDVISGLRNKLQVATASVTPAAMLAQQHRKIAEPGSAKD
jgi:short-subunit dehydrogenase